MAFLAPEDFIKEWSGQAPSYWKLTHSVSMEAAYNVLLQSDISDCRVDTSKEGELKRCLLSQCRMADSVTLGRQPRAQPLQTTSVSLNDASKSPKQPGFI